MHHRDLCRSAARTGRRHPLDDRSVAVRELNGGRGLLPTRRGHESARSSVVTVMVGEAPTVRSPHARREVRAGNLGVEREKCTSLTRTSNNVTTELHCEVVPDRRAPVNDTSDRSAPRHGRSVESPVRTRLRPGRKCAVTYSRRCPRRSVQARRGDAGHEPVPHRDLHCFFAPPQAASCERCGRD